MRKIFTLLAFFVISLVLISCEGRGKVIINEPPNADVYINGEKVGKTPIELELKEDKYTITVSTAPFIEETKKNVQVYFDKTIVLKFNPTKKGILKADTIPQGAQVLDKKEVLGITPLEVKLNPGVHEIFFQKGKLSAVRKVKIDYQKTTTVFANLEKAVVHFDINPKDGVLIIDGKRYSKFPFTLELEDGKHKVIVEKGIYKDEFVITTRRGYELKISYELKNVQLPPVQAYGPVKFTNNGKYLVSMGKAGIYFWNINKFKPEISLWDPEDVRNFDKFINFSISNNDEYVVGIKPIRKLSYQFKDNKLRDKVIVWDLKTTAPVMSKIFLTNAKFAFFDASNKNIILVEQNGTIRKIDLKGKSINTIYKGNNISAATQNKNYIYLADSKGNIYTINKSNLDIQSIPVGNGKASCIYASKDGKYLLIGTLGKKLIVLNTKNNNIEKIYNLEKVPTSIAISPKDKLIAIAFGKQVNVYDKENLNVIYKINNVPQNIISTIFRDEEVIITASSIKTPYIGIWKKGHLFKKWVQSIE